MYARHFVKVVRTPLFLGGTSLGAAVLTERANVRDAPVTAAEVQFATSSLQPVPTGWTGSVWRIRNDYPKPSATPVPGTFVNPPVQPGSTRPINQDAPWLNYDFKTNPLMYCAIIKEYCWEGNSNNGFVVQNNTVRNWYHAPWMHWGTNGREPLNGLTWERSTPPLEFSRTQNRRLQTWAIGFYNAIGSTVFGKVWSNPDSPDWNQDLQFPVGTCVFKILLTDATDAEIPTMAGAPALKAVTAANGNPSTRNTFASDVRLLQVDFAVRDDRADVGWVFGTFMYNGNRTDRDPWDRLTPVGLMWGNDPTLNQAAHDAGKLPVQSWINPEAEQIRLSLGGGRPSWGWNGRLNGPADNFISSCISCHSVAQKTGTSAITPPAPKKVNGEYVPTNDATTMKWFRNIPSGKPFDTGATSADYSLQLMTGYHNYQDWYNKTQRTAVGRFLRKAVAVPGKAFGYVEPGSEAKRDTLRQGPDMEYDLPTKKQ